MSYEHTKHILISLFNEISCNRPIDNACLEVRVKPVTIYRSVGPNGDHSENGKSVLAAQRTILHSAGIDPNLDVHPMPLSPPMPATVAAG